MHTVSTKKRSPGQTATAISLDRELFEAMEAAREKLGLDRSGFIRMCIKKQLAKLRREAPDPP